jgi:hypothetical protein
MKRTMDELLAAARELPLEELGALQTQLTETYQTRIAAITGGLFATAAHDFFLALLELLARELDVASLLRLRLVSQLWARSVKNVSSLRAFPVLSAKATTLLPYAGFWQLRTLTASQSILCTDLAPLSRLESLRVCYDKYWDVKFKASLTRLTTLRSLFYEPGLPPFSFLGKLTTLTELEIRADGVGWPHSQLSRLTNLTRLAIQNFHDDVTPALRQLTRLSVLLSNRVSHFEGYVGAGSFNGKGGLFATQAPPPSFGADCRGVLLLDGVWSRGDLFSGVGELACGLSSLGHERSLYRGELVDSLAEGVGEEVGEKSRYQGEWRGGRRHGRGCQWRAIEVEAPLWELEYEGEWCAGERIE